MKKVLEDELMSLAHRILKLRNRAEIHELKEEAAVLYEKLSILSFAEKHFEGIKPTISKYDIEKSIEQTHQNEGDSLPKYPDGTEYNEEQIYEHNTEKIKDIVSQMPYESTQVDKFFEDNDTKEIPEEKPESSPEEKLDNNEPDTEEDIQDFGVHFDDLPDFEPADQDTENDSISESTDNEEITSEEKDTEVKKETEKPKEEQRIEEQEDKPQRTMDLFSQPKKSINDSLNKDLKIGLNDRLSFIMHLFQGNKQEYEEFLDEINALDSFEKVKSFLDDKIKRRYEYWKDNEDVANRLLYLIEKKFE